MKTVQLIILILYILLSGIFAYLLAWKASSWQKGIYTLVVCLAFPGVGFLFLWYCDLMEEKKKEKDFSEFFEGKQFQRDQLQFLQEPNVEKEVNQVPMAEALTINDYEYRRNMIMQLLNEEDTLQYLDVLQDALDNRDTETSHYASTVIMELQRKVQTELMEKEVWYEKNPGQREYARAWEKILYKVLNSNLYDEYNRKRYVTKYIRVSDDLLSENPPEKACLEHRIRVLFAEKNFTGAQAFCTSFLNYYPKSETAVLCQIELFIQTKDAEGMNHFLESLSGRPVVLTQKTLQYIRIFRKE